jgi:polysaccharide export outer membrane protein
MTPPSLWIASTLLAAATVAQAPPTPPSPAVRTAASPSPLPVATLDYQIGAGDVLEVIVFGNDDLSRSATVQTNGTISLPLLGEIPVAGLTVTEIRNKLTTLLARDYLVNPQVEVKVREYQSQFVVVVGEVNSPGRKPLRGRTRLIDILVDAGGFTPRASGEIVITRGAGTFQDGGRALKLRLGSSSLSPADQVNLEVPLKSGDTVTASPKLYVTVEGEVNHPGRFLIEGELTVTGAISSAGGLTRFGSSDLKVRHVDPDTGKTKIFEVNLKAVRSGKAADLVLLPNDVVSVPRKFF